LHSNLIFIISACIHQSMCHGVVTVNLASYEQGLGFRI
jgi:hypothetical protein